MISRMNRERILHSFRVIIFGNPSLTGMAGYYKDIGENINQTDDKGINLDHLQSVKSYIYDGLRLDLRKAKHVVDNSDFSLNDIRMITPQILCVDKFGHMVDDLKFIHWTNYCLLGGTYNERRLLSLCNQALSQDGD